MSFQIPVGPFQRTREYDDRINLRMSSNYFLQLVISEKTIELFFRNRISHFHEKEMRGGASSQTRRTGISYIFSSLFFLFLFLWF